MRRWIALGLALVLADSGVAGDSGETLRLLLAKSDVVVVGEFTTEPIEKKGYGELRSYQADFRITQILKWDAPGAARAGEAIKVYALIEGEDRPPELRKGGKGLLFLECHRLQPKPSYITADLWFGVQRPSPWLAKALAEMVTEQKKTPLRVPAEKDIEQFYPDPVRGDVYFKDFKIDRADLVKILGDYQVVPKQDWKQYSHVGGGDRTGTIVLRDGAKIQYMVRPGGLASLTFPDGRKLFLTGGA